MTEQRDLVNELLLQLIDVPATQRDSILNDLCDDPNIRKIVKQRLSVLDDAGDVSIEEATFSATTIGIQKIGSQIEIDLPGYVVQRRIKSDGKSRVYLVSRQSDFSQLLALKALQPDATEPEKARFRNEIKKHASIASHSNVPLIVAANMGPSPWLLMEYIDGRPIDEYCDSNVLNLRSRIELFRQVCECIESIHRSNMIHADLKPSNLLITPNGHPYVIDFGSSISRALPESPPDALTPEYASPEQLLSQPISEASDVYSLGVLLFKLLTGASPYKLPSMYHESEVAKAVLHEKRLSMREAIKQLSKDKLLKLLAARQLSRHRALQKELPIALEKLVAKSLYRGDAVDAAKHRYQSVQELADELERYLDGLPIHAHREAPLRRGWRWLQRQRRFIDGTALTFASTILAYAIFVELNPPAAIVDPRTPSLVRSANSKGDGTPNHTVHQHIENNTTFVGPSPNSQMTVEVNSAGQTVLVIDGFDPITIETPRLEIIGASHDEIVIVDATNGVPNLPGGLCVHSNDGDNVFMWVGDDQRNTINLRNDRSGILLETPNLTVALYDFLQVSVDARGGDDSIDASLINTKLPALHLIGGTGADSLVGGAGNDILDAGSDNDHVKGGRGNDEIKGGEGIDHLIVQASGKFALLDDRFVSNDGLEKDTLTGIESAEYSGSDQADSFNALGFSGPVTLLGGGGADELIGSRYNDVIDGQEGNDTLTGWRGDDTISGSLGDDELFESADADFVFNNALEFQTDYEQTTEFGPQQNLDDVRQIEYVRIVGGPSNNIIDLSKFGLEFSFPEGPGAHESHGSVTVTGGAGNDLITGTNHADMLDGQDGDDTIYGGALNDTLYGGAGNDELYGSGGSGDVLIDILGTNILV